MGRGEKEEKHLERERARGYNGKLVQCKDNNIKKIKSYQYFNIKLKLHKYLNNGTRCKSRS